MPGLNVALEIGKRALLAHQVSLQTTAHNLANASTEGYSRQVAVSAATLPEQSTQITIGQLGTGVQIVENRRLRDIWLDQQIWRDNQTGGYWGAIEGTYGEMETFFPESSGGGINTVLGNFFNAWQELSQAAEQTTSREEVLQSAISLANAFNTAAQRLTDLRDVLDKDVESTVNQINEIAKEIGSLNYEIRLSEWQGKPASDLRDRRDLLVDQLSELVNIQVTEQADSTITVTVGGDTFIQGDTVEPMQTVAGGSGFLEVQWASSGAPVAVTNGKLYGLIYSRDTVVPSYQTDLDDFAAELIDAVNTQHALGFDLNGAPGGVFFAGTDAATMTLNAAIAADPSLIAAASTNAPGDNGNALAIAMLADQATMPAGSPTTTFSGFYSAMVGRLGTESREATRTVENQRIVTEMLEQRRQAVSGVNMDEEMSQLIKYQHAFEAAARVVTTVDELLELVANRLGMIGR